MNQNRASLPPVDDELWSLVETFVAGAATQDERLRLETRLRSEPPTRLFYVAYLDLHAQLQWRTRGKRGVCGGTTRLTGVMGRAAPGTRRAVPRKRLDGAAFFVLLNRSA